MFHTCQTTNKVKKTVRFNPISKFVDLGNLINLEDEFLSWYPDFSNNVLHTNKCHTIFNHFEVCTIITQIQNFFLCPCTSSKEIDLLFK